MRGEYINALEVRGRWIRCMEDYMNTVERQFAEHRLAGDPELSVYLDAIQIYTHVMEEAEIFYMNDKFCSLVDHARLSIPDDIKFEMPWVLAPTGWIYLEEEFAVPRNKRSELEDARIRAVGWDRVYENGEEILVCVYREYGGLYNCWSHFRIRAGDSLLEALYDFENVSSPYEAETFRYERGRLMELLHEVRWVYTAMHLMSQKLTHIGSHPTDRHYRRRTLSDGGLPVPELRVISLRRQEAERLASTDPKAVDWQWQWEVRGHWRLQPYADGSKKQIFIEAYIKGPESKPLKNPGAKLFVARR